MVPQTSTSPLQRTRSKRLWAGVGALLVAGLIADTITGVMYGPLVTTIMADTNFSAADIGWFLNASTLGIVVSVALTSRMGDIYGSRKVLIAVSIIALLGSLVVGLMSSFWPLVIGRFLIGFSTGIPLGWGIVRPLATATQTQRISVWLGTVSALFTPIALVLSGLSAVVGASWRSATWFLFALFALQLLFALASRNAPIQPPTTTGSAKPSTTGSTKKLDWIGAIGLGLWATAILLGINTGSEQGWTSPMTVTYLALGIAIFVAWVAQQRRATSPVMSFENMDLRQTIAGYLAMVTIGFQGTSFFFGLPNMMQTPSWGLGADPLTSTWPLLMVFPGTLIAGQLVKFLLPRIGPKLFLPSAALASVAVNLGIAFAHDSYWLYFLWAFLYGALIMCIYTGGFVLVASSTRQDNSSSVFGVQTIVQFLAAAVAVAIVFIVIAPGPDGLTPEASYVKLWVGVAIFLVIMALVWWFLAPRQLTDRHAPDSTEAPSEALGEIIVPSPPTDGGAPTTVK